MSEWRWLFWVPSLATVLVTFEAWGIVTRHLHAFAQNNKKSNYIIQSYNSTSDLRERNSCHGQDAEWKAACESDLFCHLFFMSSIQVFRVVSGAGTGTGRFGCLVARFRAASSMSGKRNLLLSKDTGMNCFCARNLRDNWPSTAWAGLPTLPWNFPNIQGATGLEVFHWGFLNQARPQWAYGRTHGCKCEVLAQPVRNWAQAICTADIFRSGMSSTRDSLGISLLSRKHSTKGAAGFWALFSANPRCNVATKASTSRMSCLRSPVRFRMARHHPTSAVHAGFQVSFVLNSC